ncbi:MAG TPA: ABC transporter permease [Bryobacteraceae bacterium]|nr:ABC transporter permease [Bryobacteraceae bacterium]
MVLETFISDTKIALRGMRRNPGYALLAAGTLAISIGACTAVFTLAHAILVRPLPYKNADRLVRVYEDRGQGFSRSDTSPGNFRHLAQGTTAFSAIAMFHPNQATITEDGDPERIDGARVEAGFFDVLGVKPALGRFFQRGEDTPGANDLVVLSYELWTRRYAGNTSLVGRTIRLNGQPHKVVGVLPPKFQFAFADTHVWTPLGLSPEALANRSRRYFHTVARLREGVDIKSAQASLDAIAPQFVAADPEVNRAFRAVIVPLRDDLTGDVRDRVLMLAAAVVLVLLIGCANVAHLILSRSVRRSSELALRMSLGANRQRLISQLLTESFALAAIGGLLGFILAVWSLKALIFLIPPRMLAFTTIAVDARTVLLSVGLALVACLISGLAPAIHLASVNWHQTIRQGSARLVGGVRHERLRGILVITETAIAVILVIGAGLLIRTLVQVLNVMPGFQAEGVLTAVTAPSESFRSFEERVAFVNEALTRVKSIPGVTHAAYMSAAPFTWKGGILRFDIEGELPQLDRAALQRQVTPEYFRTLRIELRHGREFNEFDRASSVSVAIVNQALVRRYLRGGTAIGRRVRINGPGFTDSWITIVGVIGDVKEMGLLADAHPVIYLPHTQTRADFNIPFQLAVRTDGNPSALVPAIRRELNSAWPSLPIAKVRLMTEIVDIEMADRKPITFLAGALAATAIALSCAGIYGLLAFSIAQRIPEIGIRVALGAQASDILKTVLARGMLLSTCGGLVGVFASVLLVNLMRGVLYEVKPFDPASFALAPVLVLLLSFGACLIPALSSLKIDPAQALRSE